MNEILKAIIELGKGNIDFLAFALIAVLATIALVGGVAVSSIFGLVVLLCCMWVMCRYALLKLQSHEQLRNIQREAETTARKTLEKHAAQKQIDVVVNEPEKET